MAPCSPGAFEPPAIRAAHRVRNRIDPRKDGGGNLDVPRFTPRQTFPGAHTHQGLFLKMTCALHIAPVSTSRTRRV